MASEWKRSEFGIFVLKVGILELTVMASLANPETWSWCLNYDGLPECEIKCGSEDSREQAMAAAEIAAASIFRDGLAQVEALRGGDTATNKQEAP